MGVGELAERLNVRYRDLRYIMEQGILPGGVSKAPGRGEHRELTAAQAFWLAIVMNLKMNGVRASLAGEIAEYSQRAVQGVARNLNWDHNFAPFNGQMETDFEWYVECGDLDYIRLVTSANPSKGGRLEAFDWILIKTKKLEKDVTPIVTIRIDLARLARQLV